VLHSWAQQDPDAVLQWAQNAPPADRLSAQHAALSKKLQEDSAAALPVINTLLQATPTEEQGTSYCQDLAHLATQKLYQDDPQAATQWASQLAQGAYRDHAISNIASQWANDDPVEASVWVRGLPAGAAKDGAVQSLVSNIVETDPSSAFAWASSMSDPSRRDSSVSNVFHQWKQQDPAAAVHALQNAPISQETRDSLLKQPDEQAGQDSFEIVNDPFRGQ
jgi:hypothetical protein